jgi:hypothetical protein
VIISNLDFEALKSQIEENFSLPEGRKIKYPKSPKRFPKPSKNLLRYSLSEIIESKKKLAFIFLLEKAMK